MNKLRKIIVIIIDIVIIGLIIFFSKDYIIRQYFINKIKDVYYDEYIITTSYNGKKADIAYYTDEFGMIWEYNDKEHLNDTITIYDYTKDIQYEYFIKEDRKEIMKNQDNFEKSFNLNNSRLLNCLKNKDKNKRKFKYKGIEKIGNRECYVLYFEEDNVTNTFYLDKENLYVVREIFNNTNNIYDADEPKNNCVILDYEIDFDLKQKYLFEIDDK